MVLVDSLMKLNYLVPSPQVIRRVYVLVSPCIYRFASYCTSGARSRAFPKGRNLPVVNFVFTRNKRVLFRALFSGIEPFVRRCVCVYFVFVFGVESFRFSRRCPFRKCLFRRYIDTMWQIVVFSTGNVFEYCDKSVLNIVSYLSEYRKILDYISYFECL